MLAVNGAVTKEEMCAQMHCTHPGPVHRMRPDPVYYTHRRARLALLWTQPAKLVPGLVVLGVRLTVAVRVLGTLIKDTQAPRKWWEFFQKLQRISVDWMGGRLLLSHPSS